MLERVIYQVLTGGIEAMQADPSILERHFVSMGLGADEIASLLEKFAAHPPTVKHGYAHSADPFPLMCIMLADENESTTYLGDDHGMDVDETSPTYQADAHGSIWQHVYRVLVYSDHPEVTLWYYELAKMLLIQAISAGLFRDAGTWGMQLSGAELEPDRTTLPDWLFLRALSIRCEDAYETTDLSSRIGKAWQIRGLSVAGGSPNDGGVEARVEPYEVEE